MKIVSYNIFRFDTVTALEGIKLQRTFYSQFFSTPQPDRYVIYEV